LDISSGVRSGVRSEIFKIFKKMIFEVSSGVSPVRCYLAVMLSVIMLNVVAPNGSNVVGKLLLSGSNFIKLYFL
jgi:hypothetical protein